MRCQRVSKVCPEPSENMALPAPNSQLLTLTAVQGSFHLSSTVHDGSDSNHRSWPDYTTLTHMHTHIHAFTCTSARKHTYIHGQSGMHLPKVHSSQGQTPTH